MDVYKKLENVKILLILSAFSILVIQAESKALSKREDKNTKLFERTLSALQKGLNFYHKDYDSINFDSLLGLRVAQGSLRRILIDNNGNGNLKIKERYLSRIRTMYTTAEKITDEAIPFVREDNVEQYEKFYKIISKPWARFSKFQKLNPPMDTNTNLKNVLFDGPTSDYCISLLLADSGTKEQCSCNITDYCWKYETQKNLDGYTPTHQILYFLFGLEEGCENTFNEKFQEMTLKDGVQGFFAEICSNIFRSAKKISQEADLLKIEKDLFMEQTLVCSLTGYEDFLTESYLEIILDWQTDIGCFGNQVIVILLILFLNSSNLEKGLKKLLRKLECLSLMR